MQRGGSARQIQHNSILATFERPGCARRLLSHLNRKHSSHAIMCYQAAQVPKGWHAQAQQAGQDTLHGRGKVEVKESEMSQRSEA